MEALEQRVKAYTYYELREKLINSEEVQKSYNDSLKDLEKKEKHLKNLLNELEKQKSEIKDKEAKLIPEEDKKNYENLKNKKCTIEAQINRNKNEHIEWEAKKNEYHQGIEKNKLIQARKIAGLQRANEEIAKFRDNNADLKQTLESFRGKLQAMERGVDINENFTAQRIEELERKRGSLIQEINSKEGMINSYNKKIATRKTELANARAVEKFDFTEINTQIVSLEQQINQIKSFSEEELSSLENDKLQYEGDIAKISRNLDRMDQNQFALNYTPPESNFDKTKVKGRVIRLIRLKEEKYARALESVAGGRLSSIVVDTDLTAQLLLQRKTFGNASFLPNNKMIPHIIPNDIKRQVEASFGNKARLALDLIEYNQENSNSIAFVFGNFFVCETKEIAEKIAYDKRFKRIAVTLEGDVFNPNGTLSGGESSHKPSTLAEFYRFQEEEKNMQKAQKKLSDVTKRLHEIEKQKEKLMILKNELDLKKITKHNKEKALQDSSIVKLTNEIEECENTINETMRQSNDLKKQDLNLAKEIENLKRQSISDPKDALIKTIAKVESDLKKSTDQIKKTQTSINELEGEIESNSTEIKELTDKIQDLTEKIENSSKEIDKLSATIATVNTNLQEVKVLYENKVHELMRHKENSSEVQENLEKYSKQLETIKRDQNNIEIKRKNMQKDSEQNLKLLEELESKYPYIAQMEAEVQNFDINFGREKLEILKNESERQSKRINKKVSSTIDDHQKRYDSLNTKKEIVVQDKQRLHEIIIDLDKRKQECIEDTWKKVDKNLGEIYSLLLPGTTAKLESVDELKGLEMRVAFNGDWKENLGELSGGQRSLLALSFILALLKYNPAPIYILDEIDAALDMSHTQNIGLMLSTHFSQSQFIVVSLKEGMFTNANVLFRTQFVDGKSVVERHALAANSADEQSKGKKKYR